MYLVYHHSQMYVTMVRTTIIVSQIRGPLRYYLQVRNHSIVSKNSVKDGVWINTHFSASHGQFFVIPSTEYLRYDLACPL